MGIFRKKALVKEFNPHLQDCPVHGLTDFAPYLDHGFSCGKCLKEGFWRDGGETMAKKVKAKERLNFTLSVPQGIL